MKRIKKNSKERIFWFFHVIGWLIPGCSIQLKAQEPSYGTGNWDRKIYGNHRAVIEVKDAEKAVLVHVPWRRRDNPGGKTMVLVDASSGKLVKKIYPVMLTAEYGDVVFEPTTGPGEYYLYYMPYKSTGSWYFPSTVYPKPDYPHKEWFDQLNISTLSRAVVSRFESVNAFNSFYPMEVVATSQEVEQLVEKNKGKDFLLFPEDRKFPVRIDSGICMRWAQDGDRGSFNGIASRNEFYTYQLGVFAAFHALRKVRLQFSDLKDEKGGDIPATAIRCFNMGGKDWLGKSFEKKVDIQKGMVSSLWVGVDIPRNLMAGVYNGWVDVKADGIKPRRVSIRITINDSILENRGYDEPFRMSRLNWLDSETGLDDSVYRPYEPVVLHGRNISILGRSLQFDKYGFPEKIMSSFTGSNELVNGPARNILSAPVKMMVVSKGKELGWKGAVPSIISKAAGAVSWKTQLRSDGASMEVCAKMECDGYINYQVTLSALEDITFDNIALQIPYARNIATFMMGLGYKGGSRPAQWNWKWDKSKANNMVWIGDVNAGLQCKLKNETPDWTLYNFDKTGPYKDWSNEGLGGCNITEETGKVLLSAFTGRKQLYRGQSMHLNFGLLITPLKILDKVHWSERYFQDDPPVDNWRQKALDKGATVMNIHQGNILNPYINYPFLTTDTLKRYVAANREKGIRTKLYYTVRELSNYTPEIWPLRSLGNEIFTPGLGAQLADQFADDGLGGNLYATGGSWLVEHLRTNYDAAWHTPLEGGEYDMSIRTQGLSRWHNYYLEGLGWLVKNTGIRGIYLDGVGYDREIMKRVRKVMDRAADSCLIDFHSGNNYLPAYGMNSPANQYMELFPCINSLWLGEGYNYNETPEYWLVEMAGIPYGLYGEMLNGCGNAYRGMLFGMTSRLGWLGCDPSELWKLWDAFGIKDARMVGFWDPSLPVKCNNNDIKVTVYQKEGKLLIAYAGWAKQDAFVRFDIDWKAVGLDPEAVIISTPAVKGFQEEQKATDLGNIKVPAGKGGILIVERK